LAEGDSKITVTKRNEIVGVYTPKSTDVVTCERHKFNNVRCSNVAVKEVKVKSVDQTILAKICDDCFGSLISSVDNQMEVEVLNEM